jgi:hypothetical protein
VAAWSVGALVVRLDDSAYDLSHGLPINGGLMNDDNDRLRLWLTFGIVVFAILVVLVAFFVTVLTFKHKAQAGQIVPAVLGVITAAVGTLAGLIAGHTAGSAGKESAERRADTREQEAAAGRTLAASLEAEEAALDTSQGGRQAGGLSEPLAEREAIRRHADLARRLFPKRIDVVDKAEPS